MKELSTATKLKGLALMLLIGWAYFPTLRELFGKWMNEPQYSHGILVPLFSLYLLFRNPAGFSNVKTAPIAGFAMLIVAILFRISGAMLYFPWLDATSMLFAISGCVVILGGWSVFRWAAPAILFLVFMIPLPYRLEVMMGAQLQRIATISSTFLLQTLGLPAIAEGNTILIEEIRLGVVEACSGLRMMMTFLAFSVGAILVLNRSKLEKLFILFSAVPIALVANILRITGTGFAHVMLKESENREGVLNFIHDFNGWLMMPIGLLFLALELWILRHLLLTPEQVAMRKLR